MFKKKKVQSVTLATTDSGHNTWQLQFNFKKSLFDQIPTSLSDETFSAINQMKTDMPKVVFRYQIEVTNSIIFISL